MKRVIICIFTALIIFAQLPCAAAETEPVYADGLNEGIYDIEVSSSSSMFRIVHCSLINADGKMKAVMTLSGRGYEKLYMGTGSEAAQAPDSECIYFEEDDEGKYTYTIPVEALNTEISCAAWSIKKQQWYDRTLVFKADSLPGEAVKRADTPLIIVEIAAAAMIAAAVTAVIVRRKRRKKE